MDYKLHANYCLLMFYFHYLHLLLCAVEDYDFIGPPEFKGKMTS